MNIYKNRYVYKHRSECKRVKQQRVISSSHFVFSACNFCSFTQFGFSFVCQRTRSLVYIFFLLFFIPATHIRRIWLAYIISPRFFFVPFFFCISPRFYRNLLCVSALLQQSARGIHVPTPREFFSLASLCARSRVCA